MTQVSHRGEQTLKAVSLMTAGMVFVPLGDTFAKLAVESTSYSSFAVAWARFVLGMLIVLPVAQYLGRFKGLKWRFVTAQILRGSLLAATIVCIITAVGKVPLADAYGAFFVGPAIATLLARFVLGETVGRFEWWALFVGFIGVVLVLKPSASIAPGQLWALGAGCFYGSYLTATRWANSVGPPLAQLAGQLCVGTILLAPFGLRELMTLEFQSPAYLFGSGVSSALGNLLAISAFGFARAATLTPLVYFQLIAVTILGYFIFGYLPDVVTSAGLLIVLVAGASPLFFHSRRKVS
jgi:drug/metabolite transporter (DMT)-like permease